MITEKTLFILGAGAHVPYGFPDAKGLRKQIIRDYPNEISNMYFRNLNVWSDILEKEKSAGLEFVKAFRASNLNSIDLFISLHPDLSITGKKAICVSMIENETVHTKIMDYYDKDDWFRYLYNKAMSGIQSPDQAHKFLDNKFSFITFNYDRLIENYLAQSLKNTFKLDPSELYTFLNSFRVRHVYGKIASIPEEIEITLTGNPMVIDYGSSINKQQLDAIYENIKIMYDERVSEKDWSDIISTYDRIFFLGFGYADENMKVLNLPHCLREGQKIYGTAFHCTQNEIDKIRYKFYSSKNRWTTFPEINLKIENQDNLTLLRNYL